MIGRGRWKSVRLQVPAQTFDVLPDVEPKYVGRTPLIDAIAPEQPPDRLEPPEANNGPTPDDDVLLQEPVQVEETGESEREDPIATPTRKKPLRRRRGKKKKGPNLTAPTDNDEPEGETETDAAVDIAEASGKIQLVVPTPVTAAAMSPALTVSDEILGMSGFMCSALDLDHSFRFRFPRNCGF